MIFNYYGLIIIIIIMIPNIIFMMCHKENTNSYHNRIIEIMEQIGRYALMLFMIVNIPCTYYGFFLNNGLLIYIIVNSLFSTIYIIGWISCWNNHKLFRSYLLSITPVIMFLFCGIMLGSIPLIISTIIFGISHIIISLKNAYH